MGLVFNPLIGNFDFTGSGGGSGSTPGGPDTAVQFNDANTFGGDAGLTYNKTTTDLTIGEDGGLILESDTSDPVRLTVGANEASSGEATLFVYNVTNAPTGLALAATWNYTDDYIGGFITASYFGGGLLGALTLSPASDGGSTKGELAFDVGDGGITMSAFDTDNGNARMNFNVRGTILQLLQAGRITLNRTMESVGVISTELDTPSAPDVVNVGTPGVTTYTYKVVATTYYGHTEASSGGTTTTGHASLDGTNFNNLSWSPITNAIGYDVYRTVGGATQGLIASGLTDTTLDDTGLAGGGETPPATNTTGDATIAGRMKADGYESADGTSGITDSGAAVASIEVKNGLVTDITFGGADYLSVLSSSEISITSATTATISRQHVISGTSANYTVTLPAASGNTGKFLSFRVANTATKLFTLDGNASETIDGALTRIIWAGETCTLYCDGSNWFKIAGRTIPMACVLEQDGYSNGDGQSINATTVTVIDLDTTATDNTGTMADLTNNKILISRPGTYEIAGSISYLNMTASRAIVQSQINGTAFWNAECSGTIGAYPTPFGTKTKSGMVATDYIQLIAYQNSVGANKVDGHNAVTWISAVETPTW